MGLPLSGQLSKYSKDKYPLLASKGPNDGLTLLRDVIAPNSLTIIALGSDHFFAEDPKINAKTIALTILVISYLEGKKHQCHRLSQLTKAVLNAIDYLHCECKSDSDGDGVYGWESGAMLWTDLHETGGAGEKIEWIEGGTQTSITYNYSGGVLSGMIFHFRNCKIIPKK